MGKRAGSGRVRSRGGTHHPSWRKALRGVGDAAVLDLGEPPAEVVVRGRPEVRDLDPGAGDRAGPPGRRSDPRYPGRPRPGRGLRYRIEGRVSRDDGWSVTVPPDGLIAGFGSSEPKAPTATTPAVARVVAARIPIEAIFSLVMSMLLMMRVVKAAAVAELGAAGRGRDRRASQGRGNRRASPGRRAVQHAADGPGGDPSPNQAIPQPSPSLGQPVPQRRLGPSQMTGGLVVGQALQVAEDHRQPLAIGQAVELFVDDGRDFGIRSRSERLSLRGGHRR